MNVSRRLGHRRRFGEEKDWDALDRKIEAGDQSLTSALALWESVVALTRVKAIDIELAETIVRQFVSTNGTEIVPVTAEIGTLAIEASRRFGRGRHEAALNFGDCFAYACAKALGVPLLFKGEDFVRTDIAAA